jgi:alkylation response protein AidB-like acyl-CoA dehydrogenase
MTPELRVAALRGAESRRDLPRLVRQMGATAGWRWAGPSSMAASGYKGTEQLIFFEEANIAGAPLPFVTISTVGPALMEFGTELQKQRFLPGIASGEINFAIGYSEPTPAPTWPR